MKTFSTGHKAALNGPHSFVHLLKMHVGAQTYRLTDSDKDEFHGSELYEPDFILEIGEYEQTAQPSMDDHDFVLSTADPLFRTLGLGGDWVNRNCTLYRQTADENGVITETEEVFSGFLSEFTDNPKAEAVTFTASSVWADFQKVAGLRTNVKSQSRFFSGDQAFRHAINAVNSILWGREFEGDNSGGGGSGGGGNGGGGRPPTPVDPVEP